MKIEQWHIEDIIPYENNPRINDMAVDKVAMSMEQYGWRQPIVVDGVKYRPVKCRDDMFYYKKRGESYKFTISNCEECGKKYMANLNNFKRVGRLFCSLSCAVANKNKRPEQRQKVSEGLKKKVAEGNYLSEDRIKKLRLGSKKYYLENEEKVRAILVMASEIAMKTVRSGRNYRGHFYGTKWRNISKRLREKIPYCQFCGSQKLLQVHHIIPYKYQKDNTVNNLLVLCARCHKKVEYEVETILDESQDFNTHRMLLKCLYEDRLAIIRGMHIKKC